MQTPLPHYRRTLPRPGQSRRGDRILVGVGLSTAHISSQPDSKPRIAAWIGASEIELRPPRYETARRVGGGKRGHVETFSKHSRRRLLRLLSHIRKDADLPLFVTLTYPAQFPTARESKQHLDAFLHRLRRAHPQASALWRLESQKRGAPHYHLMVWGVPYLPYKNVALWWYEIVGSGDENHLLAGTQVKKVRSWRGVWSYASKYLAKPSGEMQDTETWHKPGRYWGIHNRSCLPLVEPTIVSLSEQTYYIVRRYIRRYRRLPGAQGKATAVRMFTDAPHRWLAVALRTDPHAVIEDWKA